MYTRSEQAQSDPDSYFASSTKSQFSAHFLGPSIIPPMKCSVEADSMPEAGICTLCLHHAKRNPSKQRLDPGSHLGVLATRGPVTNLLGFLCPVYTKVGSVSKLM